MGENAAAFFIVVMNKNLNRVCCLSFLYLWFDMICVTYVQLTFWA